jgi:hypothetical protein
MAVETLRAGAMDDTIPGNRTRVLAATVVVLAWGGLLSCNRDRDPCLDRSWAIHDAARDGDLGKAEALLRANPALVLCKDNGGYYDGQDPLHVAVENGHKDVAELLLANKADANDRDRKGQTPLHLAAEKGYRDLAELLLANGADVNAKDRDDCMTPLHRAAYGGSREMVELLLANGADVNADAASGSAPMHLAEEGGHKGVAELLRGRGGRNASTPGCFPSRDGSRDSLSSFVWPSWLPQYPHWYWAEYDNAYRVRPPPLPGYRYAVPDKSVVIEQSDHFGSFTFVVDDSPAHVVSFYRDECKALGMGVKLGTDIYFDQPSLVVATDAHLNLIIKLVGHENNGGIFVNVQYAPCPHNYSPEHEGGPAHTDAEELPCFK